MMRRKHILFIWTLLLVAGVSCSKQIQVQDDSDISIKDAAVKGELLVKFTQDVADILESNGRVSGTLAKAGIEDIDLVLAQAGVTDIQRVFPRDSRTEERTRDAGLNLWYLVRFDASSDIEQVGRSLAALGQVSGVEYNHTIKRAYSPDKRAIPFDIASASYTKAGAGHTFFNDPYAAYQWNLSNDGTLWERGFRSGADVNAENAWKKSTGDPSVIVAVVDEGIFYSHPDLASNMWHNEGEIFASPEDNDGNGYAGDYYGYNFVQNTGQISYSLSHDTGHGTHVAGVIAARNNNGVGISSIAGGDASAPGVKIMSCQIFSGNYVASILAEVRAIKYAADNGAVVLQCSWGYTSSKANAYDWTPQYGDDDSWMTDCPIEKDAILYFINNAGSPNGPVEGGIGVFASGNESAAAAGYPGAYGPLVSVIGTAPDFTPAVYTNYGWRANICAPGGDQDYFYDYVDPESGVYGTIGCILSTVPYHISESGYAYFEGSSMATPHVSSAIALAISYAAQNHLHFTADQIRELLYSSARPLDGFMNGTKLYYKYVADLGQNQLKKMELDSFKGQMGAGQLDVDAFLDAVISSDDALPMRFPNVYVAPSATASYDAALYFDSTSGLQASVDNSAVAQVSVTGTRVMVKGLSEGVTRGHISSGSQRQDFTITVREGAGNGWLY